MQEDLNQEKNSRRAFLENISKAGVLTMLPMGLSASPLTGIPDADDNQLVQAGPYLQNISTTGVTVMWVTSRNCLSWVEYGESFLHRKAFNYVGGLIQANNRVNKVRIPDLNPGEKQNYRIVSAEIISITGSQFKFAEPVISEIFSFTTPTDSDKEFRMVVINDHHERTQTIPQLLYKFGYEKNKRDFDLVLFNGDVFTNVNSEQQVINQFLKPCVEIFAKEIPFLFVQGNHEVRGAWARHIGDYLDFKDGVPYHAFTRGPVRFIVLDAGEDKDDDNWEYNGLAAFDQYRSMQAKWLAKEIESEEHRKAPFRVLLIHISPWHSGDWHGPLHCQKVFGPLLNKARIDLQLSGHTHKYMTHDANADHNFPIIIGGGPAEGTRTFIKLHADQRKLQVNMLRDDGTPVGGYTISRK